MANTRRGITRGDIMGAMFLVLMFVAVWYYAGQSTDQFAVESPSVSPTYPFITPDVMGEGMNAHENWRCDQGAVC